MGAGAAAGPRLSVAPASMAAGPRIQTVVHLRGLRPGVAVEVQVNPPAPAMLVLADVHTRTNRIGAVDQPIAFVAPRRGAYIVFVNLGAYADAHSSVPGSSLQTTLAVATPTARLAFPCGGPDGNAVVSCRLTGQGFAPAERLAITYSVFDGVAATARITGIYRRVAITDARGDFARPALAFHADPQVLAYRATVVVSGSLGERLEMTAAGTP